MADNTIMFVSANTTWSDSGFRNSRFAGVISRGAYNYFSVTQLCGETIEQRSYNGSTNQWSNIYVCSTNIPTFYKNYNNLASLVQGVCGLTMININLDNVISIDKVGCYITTSTCTNAPTTGTFYIISLPSNLTDEWFLIAFNLAGSHLYVGFTRTSLTSMAWRTIV